LDPSTSSSAVSTLASIASIFSCRRVIVEVKATHKLAYADRLQLMNYVIAMHLDVGLLLHFGPRPDIKRVLGGLEARAHEEQSGFIRVILPLSFTGRVFTSPVEHSLRTASAPYIALHARC
jgi:hypothetical protein